MKTNLLGHISAVLFFIFLGIVYVPTTYAVSLSVAPQTVTVDPNSTITLYISISVDTNQAMSTDAILGYDPSKIDITGVTTGGFFSGFSYANDPSHARLEIHGMENSLFQGKTGDGILANITIKPKVSSGSTTIDVLCGSTTASQIFSTSYANILDCSKVHGAGIIIQTQVQPTSTPIPPNPTNTTAPGQGGWNPTPFPTYTPYPTLTPYPASSSTTTTTSTSQYYTYLPAPTPTINKYPKVQYTELVDSDIALTPTETPYETPVPVEEEKKPFPYQYLFLGLLGLLLAILLFYLFRRKNNEPPTTETGEDLPPSVPVDPPPPEVIDPQQTQ